MPIKVNGTTIINEGNFANTNLSNLSEAGLAVISNAVNSAMGSSNMLGRMNYNSAISISLKNNQTYTAPSKGYLYITGVYSGTDSVSVKINNNVIITGTSSASSSYPYQFYPVSQGDVLSAIGGPSTSISLVSGFFAPQI